MTITIRQVAERANASVAAVSSVLNNKNRSRGYSDAMRERILLAAKELNYVPNRLASGLRGARTRSVGVLWSFTDAWTGDSEIGLDLLNRIQRSGSVTYQASMTHSIDHTCRQLDEFAHRRVDGLLIRSGPEQLDHPEVRRRFETLPAVVALSRAPVEGFCGDMVVHDRGSAIDEVVDHFTTCGRRRLAMAVALDGPGNRAKAERFIQRCHSRGLNGGACRLIRLDPPRSPHTHGEQHREAMERTFPRRIDVDAIFCFADIGAMYVGRFLEEHGVAVPDDVALVGFNDSEAGRLHKPPLATGDRLRSEVADRMEHMLLSRLSSAAELTPRSETVRMRFIWRESAGRVPG